MVEPPEPPEDYSEQEKQAWRAGGAAMFRLMSGFAMKGANALLETNQTDDTDPDTCQTCGDEKIDAMGGSVCPTCDV